MKRLLVVLAVLGLAGCSSFTPMSTPAKFWQAGHVVDTYQTLRIAENPECWREADPMTKALIGEHPSSGEVGLVMVAYSLGHAFISRWLDKHTEEAMANETENRGAWYVGRVAWYVGTIASKYIVVANNNSIGLGPINRENCP